VCVCVCVCVCGPRQRGFFGAEEAETKGKGSVGWPSALFSLANMEDLTAKLGKVYPVGAVVGAISPEVASEIGLSSKEEAQDWKHSAGDVKVVCGGGDAFVGILGMAVADDGQIGLMTGSSNVVVGLQRNISERQRRMIQQNGVFGPFPDAVIPGFELLEAGQPSTGSMLSWFQRNFAPHSSFRELDLKAAEIPVGSGGLLVLDCFQGCRTPHIDSKARGVIIGLSLATRVEEIYRAMLESIAYGTRRALEGVQAGRHGGESKGVREVVVVGGATKSEIFMGIFADVLGVELVTLDSPNAAMLSAAVVASAGLRISGGNLAETSQKFVRVGRRYSPDKARHELYQTLYSNYLSIYPSLRTTMHNLVDNNTEKTS